MTALTTPHASSPLASLKINHVAIRVPDFDIAVAWYADKLDFRLKQSVPVAELTFGRCGTDEQCVGEITFCANSPQ
jgi:catechol-2,3-dioxygenase